MVGHGCKSWPGTSGPPLLNAETLEVVAIHNTKSTRGISCKLNSPCEINRDGDISGSVKKGYAQNLLNVETCIDNKGSFKLELSTCLLFNPKTNQRYQKRTLNGPLTI